MPSAGLEQLRIRAAAIERSAAADRAARQRSRLAAITGPSTPTPLAALLAAPLRQLEQLRRPADRLEELERELAHLVADASPATWRAIGRPLSRLMRQARRDLRALERKSLIGEIS